MSSLTYITSMLYFNSIKYHLKYSLHCHLSHKSIHKILSYMSYIELNLEFLFSMLLVRFLYLDGTINKDGTLIFCPRNFPAARLIKAALLLGTREYTVNIFKMLQHFKLQNWPQNQHLFYFYPKFSPKLTQMLALLHGNCSLNEPYMFES